MRCAPTSSVVYVNSAPAFRRKSRTSPLPRKVWPWSTITAVGVKARMAASTSRAAWESRKSRSVAGSSLSWMLVGVVMSRPCGLPHREGQALDPPPRGRVHSAPVLAIGEFSRLTHLSVRTLRRYHDAGLLEPATVDPASGYRYYSADQIPTAQVIHRLRELDVPLPDVQRFLRLPDPSARGALVAEHLERLESELDRTRAAVASLRRLLQPEPPPPAVELCADRKITRLNSTHA